MQYFNTLPLVVLPKINTFGNNQLVTNLLTRAYLLPSLLKNVMLFYEYDVIDGDTPESLSYNYYDDVYRYWIILYSNGIIDAQSDWPKTSSQFILYLDDKYKEAANGNPVIAYTMSTIHHYEKIITVSNNSDFQKKVVNIEVDEDTYISLMDTTIQRTFSDGSQITQEISKRAVSIYVYENELNEKKRKINIMKQSYVFDMEKQFRDLMQQ